MYYDNPAEFLQASQGTIDRINRLTTIIDNLEICAVSAASGANIQSYSFQSGQSTIATSYRNLAELSNSIEAFTKIRARLLTNCQPRTTILRDADTLPRRGY